MARISRHGNNDRAFRQRFCILSMPTCDHVTPVIAEPASGPPERKFRRIKRGSDFDPNAVDRDQSCRRRGMKILAQVWIRVGFHSVIQ